MLVEEIEKKINEKSDYQLRKQINNKLVEIRNLTNNLLFFL